MDISFTSLAVVAAAAFAAPLAVGLVPALRLPSIVVEILLGILIGPSLLGWASAEEPVQVMALIGLSFLLFIAGLEVDYERFRGKLLELTGLGFVVSIALGLVAGFVLEAAGLVRSPLLIAIMFSATGLGIVIAVLKDAGRVDTSFGQLVIAGSSSTLARVPLFLAILLAVRGLPALLYRSLATRRETAAGALLQATSIGFLVVATQIGQDMGLISAANAAAVVAAGLLSVILFPLGALILLRGAAAEQRASARNEAPAAKTVAV